MFSGCRWNHGEKTIEEMTDGKREKMRWDGLNVMTKNVFSWSTENFCNGDFLKIKLNEWKRKYSMNFLIETHIEITERRLLTEKLSDTTKITNINTSEEKNHICYSLKICSNKYKQRFYLACIASVRLCPSTGTAEWSWKSWIINGICFNTKYSAASFNNFTSAAVSAG